MLNKVKYALAEIDDTVPEIRNTWTAARTAVWAYVRTTLVVTAVILGVGVTVGVGGVIAAKTAHADSAIRPPALPPGWSDYAHNSGHSNYADKAGEAPGGGWTYLGPSGCYWNTTGAPAAVHAVSVYKAGVTSYPVGTLGIKDYSVAGIPALASDYADSQRTLTVTGLVPAGHQICTWRTGYAASFGVAVYMQY